MSCTSSHRPARPVALVVFPFALLVATGAAAPGAAAQEPRPCHSICAPAFSFLPTFARTHVVDHPRVQDLATGTVTKLPSRSLFEMVFVLTAPTLVPRTSLTAIYSWFPNAHGTANPYTEYTASALGQPIRENSPALDVGASVAILDPQETGGWLTLAGNVFDLLSRAARPNDASAYTQKLDLQAAATVMPFKRSHGYLGKVATIVTFDYVATGLPQRGDEVPAGERVFLDDVHSTGLFLSLALPVAPLP